MIKRCSLGLRATTANFCSAIAAWLTTVVGLTTAFGICCDVTQAAAPFNASTDLDYEALAKSISIVKDIECGIGGSQPLKLDLARPAASSPEPVPCIVVIHGGAWRGGNKEQLHQLLQQFAARGYVAASLQYRLCPTHTFPAQIEDVKCAVRFLRAHAADYGIDPERMGAVGFSAGGHLSMMLGVMDKTDGYHGTGGWADQSDKVQAVVSYFGPTKLDAEDMPAISQPLITDFLGGTPQEEPEKVRAASPLTWVSSQDAPMLLFQGTKDPLVRHSQAWMMTESMEQHGVPGRVELMIGQGHGWGGEELTRTLNATYAFFNEQLKHTPPAAAAILPHGKHAATAVVIATATATEITEAQVTAACGTNDETTEKVEPESLFDGIGFSGWEGNLSVFRIEEGAIVGGQLNKQIPHNFFLSTVEDYADFELTLEFKLIGANTNAGIQIRSERIPDHHEMIGYQADLGQNYWGALYDESRRRKVLAGPDAEQLKKVLKLSDWNRYRIRCQGKRIQLWINDFQTVDYTETDNTIKQSGKIALQIHGGPPGEAWYRNLQITPLN